jgi:long-chain fatty acid transport protein
MGTALPIQICRFAQRSLNHVRTPLLLFILIIVSRAIFAQGFYFDAFDARSVGMVGSPFAGDASPASIAFDPAVTALRPGLHLSMGGMLGIRSATFTDTRPAPASDPYRVPPEYGTSNGVEAFPLCSFAYAPQRTPLGFGLSVVEPFQFHTVWPSTWFASSQATQTSANAVYATASLGYRVNKYVMAGASLHIVSGTLRAQRIGAPSDLPPFTVSSADEARGSGAAVSLSLLVRPSAQFSIAVGYTSGTNMTMKGSTTVVEPFTTLQEDMHTTMSLPTMINVGLSLRPSSALTIDASLTHLGWSGFDGWQFRYDDSVNLGKIRTIPFSFTNATTLRLGFEYVIRNALALRCGIGYASTPVVADSVSPYYPDASAILYAAGFGYSFTRNIRLDVGYRGRGFASRTATIMNVPGSYAIGQNEIAVSIALTFEPKTVSKNNPLTATR